MFQFINLDNKWCIWKSKLHKFVFKCLTYNISALVQAFAWCRRDDTHLMEWRPSVQVHISVTGPWWVITVGLIQGIRVSLCVWVGGGGGCVQVIVILPILLYVMHSNRTWYLPGWWGWQYSPQSTAEKEGMCCAWWWLEHAMHRASHSLAAPFLCNHRNGEPQCCRHGISEIQGTSSMNDGMLLWASYQIRKLWVARAPGMLGAFPPPPTLNETAS